MAEELYCDPAQAADAWPGFAQLSTTRQAALISAASAKVRDYCRRNFLQAFYSESHDGTNRPRLWLRQRPVIVVVAVSVSGTVLDNSLGDAWTVEPDLGFITRGSGLDDPRFCPWWPSGTQNIQVAYWAGYECAPPPIVEATIQTVRWLNDLQQAGGSGVLGSESIGAYSYSRADQNLRGSLPAHVIALLAPYVQDGSMGVFN